MELDQTTDASRLIAPSHVERIPRVVWIGAVCACLVTVALLMLLFVVSHDRESERALILLAVIGALCTGLLWRHGRARGHLHKYAREPAANAALVAAHQRVAESEERYRLISENMQDIVALHAIDSTVLYCSPAVEALLGYRVEKIVGTRAVQAVHPDDVANIGNTIAVFREDDVTDAKTVEYRYRHRQGHYLWLETVIVPVKDEKRTTLHYQTCTRDVTERRNAMALLSASEARFRTLTEISSDWYWETDMEHRISFLSMERSRHSNRLREDLMGYTRRELFPLGMSDEQWEEHERLLARHLPFQGVITKVHDAVGNVIGYSSLSGRPIFDAHGQFSGYRGIGRDVTRVKMAEQRLADSEERYRLMAENMRDIVSLHAAGGRVTYLSPSFSAVTGHSAPATLGLAPRHLIHAEDFRRAAGCFARVRDGVEATTTVNCRLRHRDGRYIWMECHVSRVNGESGALRHLQIVSRDVTRRREAESELEKTSMELRHTNQQLEREAHERQTLERNILLTIEMELAQVGLELHDELGQDLTGISLLSKSLEHRLQESAHEAAPDAARISALVNRTIGHTRMISHGLSPYIWGADGLISALAQLASDIENLRVVACRTKLDQQVVIADEVVARSLYRIAQEATNNALKHSHAKAITLSLSRVRRDEGGDGVILRIDDDGSAQFPAAAPDEHSSRFHSIRHRCRVIGANLLIRHGRLGGTRVRVEWNPGAAFGDTSLVGNVLSQEAYEVPHHGR